MVDQEVIAKRFGFESFKEMCELINKATRVECFKELYTYMLYDRWLSDDKSKAGLLKVLEEQDKWLFEHKKPAQ